MGSCSWDRILYSENEKREEEIACITITQKRSFTQKSEYQEQIDALKEAIRSSVKSEILEEMNRLRAENEKLQGIKEHFEEVKKDYEKKKDECDRIARNAEYNAKKNETY